MTNIRSARGRAALEPRREPYWEALGAGLSVGLYIGASGGAWKVRTPNPVTGSRWSMATLGKVDALDFPEAVRAAQDWADSVTAPTPISAITVGGACGVWVASKEAATGGFVADYTRRSWIINSDIVRGFFGDDTPLDQISKSKCEEFRDRPTNRRQKRNAATGDRDLANAKAIFSAGADGLGFEGKRAWVDARKMGGNIAGIQRADSGDDGLGGRALDLADMKKLIAGAEKNDPAFANFIRAMFLTCQRPQALRMADVRDFDRKRAKLQLRRGKNAAKRGVVTIDLFDGAVDLFTHLAGNRGPDEPLLPDDDGNRWLEQFQRRRFERAVRNAGLDPTGLTFYAIRHSAITWAIQTAKVDPMTVATIADTGIEMILKHYFRRTERLGAGPQL
jgi:integrase